MDAIAARVLSCISTIRSHDFAVSMRDKALMACFSKTPNTAPKPADAMPPPQSPPVLPPAAPAVGVPRAENARRQSSNPFSATESARPTPVPHWNFPPVSPQSPPRRCPPVPSPVQTYRRQYSLPLEKFLAGNVRISARRALKRDFCIFIFLPIKPTAKAYKKCQTVKPDMRLACTSPTLQKKRQKKLDKNMKIQYSIL